jgi:hypothetical protein
MGGGGAEAATANGNVLLNTTRMEALGLVAGMSYAWEWKGPVKWYLDNNGARRNYRKMRHWTAYDWRKAGDRDVFGYMELLRARLAGKWEVLFLALAMVFSTRASLRSCLRFAFASVECRLIPALVLA